MKYLFLLLFSFNVFAESPPANSFKGNVYGYEVAVFVNQIFSGEYGIRSLYFSNGEWQYLAEPSCFTDNMTTAQDVDYCFGLAVNEINEAIEATLKPVSTEPSSGVMRLQWLIENKLKIQSDKLLFAQ